MKVAMRPAAEQVLDAPIGRYGALLGVSRGLYTPCLAERFGVYVATDADLRNYEELRTEHKNRYGDEPASVADIIAALYERRGVDCIGDLEGAFAVALWDAQLHRLLLGVDRHSFKTLYWNYENGRLVFGSRLRAVESVKNRLQVNPAAVMQFLVHTVVPAPLTIYKEIEQLEPGSQLIFEKGRVKKNRYWDVNYQESTIREKIRWREELRECMRVAVHDQLGDCSPEHTGAYLSGGTDSSSVVAFASERCAPVNTFSIYFGNRRYDEIEFARAAAEQFGTRHHERCLESSDAAEAISKIIEQYDQPFANSSAVGAYHCAKLASDNGVDLLLAGDGGDELFAGNERYATDKKFAAYHHVPNVLRSRVIRPFADRLPESGLLSLPARYIRRAELANPQRMFSYNFFLTQEGIGAMAPDFLREAKPETAMAIAKAHFDSAPQAQSELSRLLYLDVKMTLSDNDLRKVIDTAEIAGVRVRFPLLDRRLVELSGRIPSRLKLRGLRKRYIFKEAMKGILPDKILYKKKHGFGIPVGYWMMNDPTMKELAGVLNEAQSRERGYFRPDFLLSLRNLNETHPAYFGEVMWVVLMLELWHRRSRVCLSDQAEYLRVGAAHAD